MASSVSQGGIDSYHHENEHIWSIEDIDKPQQTLLIPSLFPTKTPSHTASANNLRIKTAAELDPHDHYISSEEEPSPSPDSDTASHLSESENDEDEQLNDDNLFQDDKENTEPIESGSYDSKAEIAVAVPIMALGPPKLVDITRLAPLQKRKRANSDKDSLVRSAVRNAASFTVNRPPLKDMSNPPQTKSSTANEAPEGNPIEPPAVNASLTGHPEDEPEIAIAEEDEEYFANLKLRVPPAYSDYDPYSLNPPRLSSPARREAATKQPGSVARARRQVNRPSSGKNLSLKTPGRSLSLTKRLDPGLSSGPQLNKKPKMLPRGPTERTEVPYIAAFPRKSA